MNQLHFTGTVASSLALDRVGGLVTADAFAEAGATVAFADVRGGKNMRNTTTPRKRGVAGLRVGRVLTTLLAVAWSILWAGAASATDAEQAVLDAHEKRRTATLAGDAAAVGSMMTDDLTFTHANAVVETKAEFLDALKTGRYQYKSLTDEERGVRVHGDTGIVSGTCRIVVTAGGKDIDIRVRFTELWVKEAGAWRMVLWHATNVP